jgi:cytochrome c551/c552
MKKATLIISVVTAFLYACSGGETTKEEKKGMTVEELNAVKTESEDPRGIGKFTDVKIDPKLDVKMAEAGQGIYDLKCSSCHKLTEERLVGPGWKDVTKRRSAEWVMNFVTNVDEMLDKDANAKALLEVCLVRMPNQNLSDEDARHIYEYMRQNDGVK